MLVCFAVHRECPLTVYKMTVRSSLSWLGLREWDVGLWDWRYRGRTISPICRSKCYLCNLRRGREEGKVERKQSRKQNRKQSRKQNTKERQRCMQVGISVLLTTPSSYPPLYTFFTTGMAGSVTTFSSWMLEGYEAFANFGRYNRSGLYDVSNRYPTSGLRARADRSGRRRFRLLFCHVRHLDRLPLLGRTCWCMSTIFRNA